MPAPRGSERARQLALGEVVAARYRVVGFLGSGGMGEVYEVEHLSLGRHFALKVLRGEFCGVADTVRRFAREARAMASVESEYVVGIVDFGEIADGTPYFVMERLRGQDLRCALMESGPLSISQTARVGVDACMGLQVVHDAGLVHRDLKPANIFVTRRANGQSRCRLLDFGVVKSIATDSTQQGSLVGTIRYMAPEQILEDGVVGPRTDIYALGAILYECLTTRAPFEGDAVERILFKILNQTPLPLAQIRKDIPLDLCDTILRALTRDPKQRFEDAASFARALAPHTGEDYELKLPLDDAIRFASERTLPHATPMRQSRRIDARTAFVLTAATAAISGGSVWALTGKDLGHETNSTSQLASRDPGPDISPAIDRPASTPIDATAGMQGGPVRPHDERNTARIEAPPAPKAPENPKLPETPKRTLTRATVKERVPAADADRLLPNVDRENPYGP